MLDVPFSVPGHVPQVCHRRVAGQHLQNEQMKRADRSELAFTPDMSGRSKRIEDGWFGKILVQII
jgi:hypothetical protein